MAHSEDHCPTAQDAAAGDSDQEAFGGMNLADAHADDRAEKERDSRPTPVPLARELKRAVGGTFDVDPCSGCEPMPIAETRYTAADDGLSDRSPWYGSVFVNPPYSNIGPWAAKAVRSTERGDADHVVMLIPSYSASSGWFHEHASSAEYLCVIDGRLKFHGADSSAPFASLLVVFAADSADVPESLLATLEQRGEVWGAEEIEAHHEQAGFGQFLAEGKAQDVEAAEGQQATPDHPRDPPLAGLAVGDLVSVQFDDQAIGFPSDLEATPTLRVLTGQERNGRVEVLCLAPDVPWNGGEQYHLLSYSQDDSFEVRAAVEDSGWQHLPLESVTPVAETGGVAPADSHA